LHRDADIDARPVGKDDIMGNMMLFRVVLDTNILVAGLRSRRGASYALLSAWLRGEFRACASVPLWLEYEGTLKREDIATMHGLSADHIDVLLDAWAVHVDPVELLYAWRPQLRDPDDEMVFETAMNGRCDALVTYNTVDFKEAARRFGLAMWRPLDLLQRLRNAR
jgi:putative PIN family toxin of toxin-antitoxin system